MEAQCEACGRGTGRWLPCCPYCRARFTLVCIPPSPIAAHATLGTLGDELAEQPRLSTGLSWLDTFVGGGLPRSLVTCIYGKPSAGKSTLGLQIACASRVRTLYCSNEQQPRAVDEYAARLGYRGARHVRRMHEANIDAFVRVAYEEGPQLIVCESWQKFRSSRAPGRAGYTPQMLHVYKTLYTLGTALDCPIVIVSQADEKGAFGGTLKVVHELDSILLRLKRGKDLTRTLTVEKTRSCSEGEIELEMSAAGLAPVEQGAQVVELSSRRRSPSRVS